MHIDKWDNLYFADVIDVRKIDLATGIITNFAGCNTSGYGGDAGFATAAKMPAAIDVIPDNCGNVYISDEYDNVIRKVDETGIIHTIAGNDTGGYRGDGNPCICSELDYPRGIALDPYGNLLILDDVNYRIRKITFPSCGYAETIQNIPIPYNMNIYPNPAYDELNITSSTDVKTVSISNILGQTIYSQQCNSQKVEVDVSTFSPGVYFVKINGVEVRKFIKQ